MGNVNAPVSEAARAVYVNDDYSAHVIKTDLFERVFAMADKHKLASEREIVEFFERGAPDITQIVDFVAEWPVIHRVLKTLNVREDESRQVLKGLVLLQAVNLIDPDVVTPEKVKAREILSRDYRTRALHKE